MPPRASRLYIREAVDRVDRLCGRDFGLAINCSPSASALIVCKLTIGQVIDEAKQNIIWERRVRATALRPFMMKS